MEYSGCTLEYSGMIEHLCKDNVDSVQYNSTREYHRTNVFSSILEVLRASGFNWEGTKEGVGSRTNLYEFPKLFFLSWG